MPVKGSFTGFVPVRAGSGGGGLGRAGGTTIREDATGAVIAVADCAGT